MKIVYWSDLHCETSPYYLPFELDQVPTADVLILAGDIGVISTSETITSLLLYIESKFDHILLVAGNHEYWHGEYNPTRMVQIIRDIGLDHKVTVFTEDSRLFRLGNVSFIGATLWTDYDDNNPMTKIMAQQSMVDFRITTIDAVDHNGVPGRRMLRPEDLYNIHKCELRQIEDLIDEEVDSEQIVIVITHHAPSYQSVSPEYVGDALNGAFVSDINTTGATYWIHGHVHTSHEYIDQYGTVILANPHGYHFQKNKDFDINKYIEI